ncbi:hypothetical protein OEA41_005716 [Lepraria neglecta]|uniref:protein-tyrosine-phosphatase n=1 Tax=Lepraria neglecta TaxID=209136 RepID=A0AAD9Z6P0_9LECA|nr:hypothetical protein OEA41_005716 [Lepraria neglecta]
MGGDEILSRVWLGDKFDNESVLKRKISTIVQVSVPNLATPVCAAFQKSGIELVRFGKGDDEHSNLLPVFGEVCNFVDKRLKQKKSVLFWETGGGAASLVAYVMSVHRIGYPAALNVVREERPGFKISEGYAEQLKVWQRCGFNVYETVKGEPHHSKYKIDHVLVAITEPKKGVAQSKTEAQSRKSTFSAGVPQAVVFSKSSE